MKTLHTAYGSPTWPPRTVLKFPGEEVVTLELVHRAADGPVQVGTGFSHLVVQ